MSRKNKLSPLYIADKIAKGEWQKIIKAKADYKCELCNGTNTLNSHHIFGKRSIYMKVLIDNGICLCYNCHRNGIHSDEFDRQQSTAELIKQKVGEDKMVWLEHIKNNPPKMTYEELKELREEYKELLNDIK